MATSAERLLERALAAKRESRRIAFRDSFDVRDLVAIANSGGGVILYGADAQIDPRAVAAEIRRFTDSDFAEFEVRKLPERVALIVGEAQTPMVSNDPPGTLYFRHGKRTEPATTEDLDQAIMRRVRRTISSALRPRTERILPPEIRDSESPQAVPIRVVEDPRAPAFRLVDYDKTHPFRQKEVLAALQSRLSMPINQFDIQAVRHVMHTDDNLEFAHKPVFGTRQYSAKFIDWLVEQAEKDPEFFARARGEYIRSRKHT
ncbi:MAG TPA: hypothetical protein VLV78_16865 [Thermoanaerobaculia bacterium]|nr:hypothetical protein [Thermoanaerobaculia bacterium]